MITTASALPILWKDPIFHIMNMSGQKLSPQDKLMLSIQSYDNDGKPHYRECPTKTWKMTGVETISLFCCRLDPPPLTALLSVYHPRVNFFIHNSYFPTSSDSRWLPKLVLHSCEGDFLYFSLFRVNDDTLLQHWGEIPAYCPLLGFTVENCTNSLITYTHADSLKYNLPKLSHLCSTVYTCTQTHWYRKCSSCQFLL